MLGDAVERGLFSFDDSLSFGSSSNLQQELNLEHSVQKAGALLKYNHVITCFWKWLTSPRTDDPFTWQSYKLISVTSTWCAACNGTGSQSPDSDVVEFLLFRPFGYRLHHFSIQASNRGSRLPLTDCVCTLKVQSTWILWAAETHFFVNWQAQAFDCQRVNIRAGH